MTEKDIQMELDRLQAEANAIYEQAAVNSERVMQLCADAREAMNAGDTEKYWACMNEAQERTHMSEVYLKLINKTAEDSRRLLVGVMGPVGGLIWDAIRRRQEEEMGS